VKIPVTSNQRTCPFEATNDWPLKIRSNNKGAINTKVGKVLTQATKAGSKSVTLRKQILVAVYPTAASNPHSGAINRQFNAGLEFTITTLEINSHCSLTIVH
jgi:hypothetical protein